MRSRYLIVIKYGRGAALWALETIYYYSFRETKVKTRIETSENTFRNLSFRFQFSFSKRGKQN